MKSLFDGLCEEESAGIVEKAKSVFAELELLDLDARITAINSIRMELHKYSPFSSEPVDFVQWIKSDLVQANDYNPNSVAPPEMKLLEHSISEDGYTQPIVSYGHDSIFEVIDGFHRHRVGKESKTVSKRLQGYLPVVVINEGRNDRSDRIASTIRHNRARGKHKVEAMSDIVVELKRRNWSDERICRELGMDQDEVLRLCQITGLADLFSDREFSKSWDVEGHITEDDFKELTDDVDGYGEEAEKFRTVNTSDESRVFHTYDKWECYRAGFYDTHHKELTKKECEEAYRDFLSDLSRFESGLIRVISEWKNSCEHYLSNSAMNRIAWLGQAACCLIAGIPSEFRAGFSLLTKDQQDKANDLAFAYLNKWMEANGRPQVSMDEAIPDRQSQIY